jgi:hypothetical protein
MAAALFAASPATAAQSLRCSGKLVTIGDYKVHVAEKCGEPHQVETHEMYPDSWISKHYDYQDDRFKAPYLLRGPILQEVWTYQFGPNRLPYYLYFQNGRLSRLETGNRRN